MLIIKNEFSLETRCESNWIPFDVNAWDGCFERRKNRFNSISSAFECEHERLSNNNNDLFVEYIDFAMKPKSFGFNFYLPLLYHDTEKLVSYTQLLFPYSVRFFFLSSLHFTLFSSSILPVYKTKSQDSF